MSSNPKLIILISGKRKSGKDYVSEKLQKRLGERSQIIRISEPIKSEWARKMDIDLDELLSDGPFKEKYRKDMIIWSDKVRADQYDYFCKKAMEKAQAEIIIVSDVRRKNDIKYFLEKYENKIKAVRIICPENIRASRGWIYTTGIDDVESECGLDDYEKWDLVIKNNNELSEDELIDIIISKFKF